MKCSRCSCGKTVIVERDLCPKCGQAMEPFETGNRAILLTHTILYTVPAGFIAPIYLVLVELETGVNLLCTSKDGRDLEIGKTGTIEGERGKYFFVMEEN